MKVQSTILGPDGEPFERDLMEREVSATSAIAGREPFAGHLAFGMDPQTLGAILRAADAGNTRSWMILAEEIEELYVHYFAVLSKRRRQVCELPIRVEDADDSAEAKQHGDFVRRWIDDDMIRGALFDATDAIGKGYSVHEIIWESDPAIGVRPRELLYRPQRYFEVSWEDGETIWLRDQAGYTELQRHKYWLHMHKSKSGQAVRSGLTRVVAFYWMFQSFTLKDWALFVQGYGFPIRLGRYGPEASGVDKATLLRAVSSISGNVSGIIPNSMAIEFVDGNREAGAKLFEGRADWLNREVSKVVLGGTAGTDAIAGGHAVGKEHRAAEQDVEKFDARLLSISMTRRLAQPMVAFTFGQQLNYPRMLIGQEDNIPLEQLVAAVADLGPQGLRVRASEIRARLDLTEPDPDETDVVGGVTPAPVDQPAIPKPAVTPPETQSAVSPMFGPLLELMTHHAAVPDELVAAMSARLAEDASGALAGLTGDVRAVFDAADSLEDLQARLRRLKLPTGAYAEAMARGMALAQLVGQASVVAELGRR
jgi:phage gp29-like protein